MFIFAHLQTHIHYDVFTSQPEEIAGAMELIDNAWEM